jgi:tetratricopeptide (TPR) repeat protein
MPKRNNSEKKDKSMKTPSKHNVAAEYFEIRAESAASSRRYLEAVWNYHQAAGIWKQAGDNGRYNKCLANCSLNKARHIFGKKYASSHDFKDAKNFFKKAAEQFQPIDSAGANWALAHAFECEYRIAKNERNLKSMIGSLDKAIEHYKQTNDELGLLASQGDLAKYKGTLLIRQKEYSLASKAFISAEKSYKDAAECARVHALSKDKKRFEMDALHASALIEFSEADEALTKHLLNIDDVTRKYESASRTLAECGNFRSSNRAKQLAQLLRDILGNKADQVRKTLMSLSSGRIELPAHEWDRLRSIVLLAQKLNTHIRVTSGVAVLAQALDITSASVASDVMERPTDYEEVLAENKIYTISYELMELLSHCNEICTSKGKEAIFKPTTTMVGKLGEIGKPVKNKADFGNLVDALFEIVYEGSAELKRIPEKFKHESFIGFTIRDMRNDLRHDLEHGKEKDITAKKVRLAEIYESYTAKTTLSSLKPEDFGKIQLRVLEELRKFLEDLKQHCINRSIDEW